MTLNYILMTLTGAGLLIMAIVLFRRHKQSKPVSITPDKLYVPRETVRMGFSGVPNQAGNQYHFSPEDALTASMMESALQSNQVREETIPISSNSIDIYSPSCNADTGSFSTDASPSCDTGSSSCDTSSSSCDTSSQ